MFLYAILSGLGPVGNRGIRKLLLHNDMTATLPNFFESMTRKNTQTCFPESIRSLPNGNLHLGYIYFFMKAGTNF